MPRWTLDDISWGCFDCSKLDPEIVPIVKAASLVEYNGGAYAHHLSRVFHDDPAFQRDARRWGRKRSSTAGRSGAGASWPILGSTSQRRSRGLRPVIGSISTLMSRAEARVQARW